MTTATVHGKGDSQLAALADIDRQVRECCQKLEVREGAIEYLEKTSPYRDTDGVWHVWQRMLI